jgi:putative molybdopterin biosynthesis protein
MNVTMTSAPALLTTVEVAKLLRVHPKHVYRLLRKGLPARRVGSEWRFERGEVLAWSRPGTSASEPTPDPQLASSPRPSAASVPGVPPLIAANGDRVVLTLLRLLQESGTFIGLVQSDKDTGFRLLTAGTVLATGSHAGGFPTHAGSERVARIHLVTREIGLAGHGRSPKIRDVAKARLASRPPSAGVRQYLDEALAAEGIDARDVNARGKVCASHLEVACAVARGDADIGLASRAWAEELGLAFRPLAREAYGLLIRAKDLGDRSVVRVCEVAQSERFRNETAAIPGYDPTGAGDIKYDGA